MLEEPDPTKVEYWKKSWEEGNFNWHQDTVHKMLQKYFDELTGGRSNVRVFVPLCGKSLDMLWLAEQGHSVVGVEVSKLAIESFFEENNLAFSAEQVILTATTDPVDVYKSVGKQITIFCCDLFALSEEDVGKRFDAIWDRGSLSAVQPQFGDRGKRYTKKMRSLLADHGKYLLESHYYELDRQLERPVSLSVEFRNKIFEEDFVLKALEVEKSGEDFKRKWGYSDERHYHLIQPKV